MYVGSMQGRIGCALIRNLHLLPIYRRASLPSLKTMKHMSVSLLSVCPRGLLYQCVCICVRAYMCVCVCVRPLQ